ncbi:MAG: glycosyltransferase family 4 protein [Chloroflexota bacterium]|nr:glycosyltransferase family 4 protein [Chloroflexota bacterium]
MKEIDAGLAPRLDYRLVAERLGAEIVECYPSPAELRGQKAIRVTQSLVSNFRKAIQLVKRIPDGSLVYSTGETWGLPTALAIGFLGKTCIHVMYVHRVYSTSWRWILWCLRAFMRVDRWITVTSHQVNLLCRILDRDAATVTAVSQGVDTRFFDPMLVNSTHGRAYLLSVGAEMRDYGLLMDAVRGMDVEVVVKASSAWMTGGRSELSRIPPNVKIITRRMSYVELRDLYAGASLVAAPLYDTPQAAGITTILEAMAMQKCVVATRSKGLPDVLVHGRTGIVVEADVRSLSHAIRELGADKTKRISLADASRGAVSEYASLEEHARQVTDVLVAAKQEDDW